MRIAVLVAGAFTCAGCAAPVPPVRSAAAPVASAPAQTDSARLASYLEAARAADIAPVTAGNDARLLVDGPATHRAMFDAMAAAREHIHLQSYIVEADEVGEQLAELLARKRAQGVKVRVLYDSVGSRGTPPEYFERLRADDVAVCEFNPVNPAKAPRGWQINNRDHRKVLVVDGRVAFTGGINISGVYSAGSFGSRPKQAPRESGWRDTHILVRGAIVNEFQRLFLDAWTRQSCAPPLLQPASYLPRPAAAGPLAMQLVGNDPERGASRMYAALLGAIGQARSRVWLTYGYFVPDPETVRTLQEAAGRGVDVRLVLPGVSDFWAPLYAGRSHYDDLLAAGVRIFERHDALVHAKTAVIDGVWSSVGSTNLDWRSFVHNYEADVIVFGAGFGESMERLHARDVKRATEVTRDAWASRGIAARLREWFARRWEYLL